MSTDGQRRTVKPGKALVPRPGQGICLPPRLYHRFWAGRAFVLDWEISMVDDDQHDSYFPESGGRFPTMEEDELVKWLLCNEYGILR